MNNPNNHEKYRSENRQETYTDPHGNTHTQVSRTTESVNNTPSSYGSGYVHGRDSERRYQQANLVERDNTNTANGLLVGVILTSLITLGVGAFWYFNQRNNTAGDRTTPVVVPVPANPSPSPEATSSPQSQPTIIERIREVPIPIPQPQAPSAPAPAQPNVNITVPPQQPARENVPTPSPQTPTNNSQAEDSNSNSPTTTPSPEANSSGDSAQ
jgi:hypothetical protein